MPRYVNHEERRRQLVEAAMVVLGEQGLQGFSLRNVARRLGGSVTVVTHYYKSRQELLDDMATSMLSWWEADLARLSAQTDDPARRLRALLEWLLPLTPEDLVIERGRINLLADTTEPLSTRHLFDAWDHRMRGFMRQHVTELVEPGRVEPTVDLLRTITNGLVLSAIERPQSWTPERLLAVLDDALGVIGLRAVPTVSSTRA
jgi:AcrR family transcriptional regulator